MADPPDEEETGQGQGQSLWDTKQDRLEEQGAVSSSTSEGAVSSSTSEVRAGTEARGTTRGKGRR